MTKVLLFPGAFNPPHYGHCETIQIALKATSFDELWVMPSGKRDDKVISIGYEDRRALGNIFVEYLQSLIDIPVKLITAELDDLKGRYTQEILREIKSNPDVQITQLIGLDGFLNIQNDLKDNSEKFIVVANRSGYEASKITAPEEVFIFLKESIAQDTSSTQIREMIQNNDKQYKNLVPESIFVYIENHHLYR